MDSSSELVALNMSGMPQDGAVEEKGREDEDGQQASM